MNSVSTREYSWPVKRLLASKEILFSSFSYTSWKPYILLPINTSFTTLSPVCPSLLAEFCCLAEATAPRECISSNTGRHLVTPKRDVGISESQYRRVDDLLLHACDNTQNRRGRSILTAKQSQYACRREE
jgi:hypothetical protein